MALFAKKNIMPNSEHNIELETKIAFLEQHINELSDVLYSQQKQIDLLNEKYGNLKNHLTNLENTGELGDNTQASDDRPPHY